MKSKPEFNPLLTTLVGAVIFFITLFVYIQDVRGTASYLDQASADVLNILFAEQYPTDHRDKIIVLEISDQTIASEGQTTPPGFSLHQTVMEKLALFEPEVVFVDFAFDQRNRGPDRNYASLSKVFARQPYKVFFATDSNQPSPVEATGIETNANVMPVANPYFSGFTQRNIYCRAFNRYAQEGEGMCLSESASADISLTKLPGAAFAIYQLYCERRKASAECKHLDAGEEEAFRLIWGGRSSSLFRHLPGQLPCQSKGFFDYLGIFDDPANGEHCSFHPTLSVEEFFCIAKSRAGDSVVFFENDEGAPQENEEADGFVDPFCPSAKTGINRKSLGDALQGAIVIYAGRFGVNPDVVTPPTTGPIAGAHFHAMALDNLLTFAGKPKRDTVEFAGWQISGSALNATFFTICFFLALYLERQIERNKIGTKTDDAEVVRDTILFLVITMASLVYAAVGFVFLGLAPVNWIGGLITGVFVPRLARRMVRSGSVLLQFISRRST